jgi:hypothetical protein
MRATHFMTCFFLATLALSASAFERPFPPAAKRGTMSPANYPQIVIDGQTRNLSVAARIWNTENLIEMPGALRGSGFKVNYTEDSQHDIDRVWILNADEASQTAPNLRPENRLTSPTQ